MKTGYIWEMFLIRALLNKKNRGIYRIVAVLRDRELMAELSDNVKGTDKLLAESLAAAGDMQSNPHAGISAFVYSEDTLKALFTSLSGE